MITPKCRSLVSAVLVEHGISERRGCETFCVSHSSYRYPVVHKNEEFLKRIIELSRERHSFGYRRMYALLKRERWNVNIKQVYRLYRNAGLCVRKRSGRKHAIGTRGELPKALYKNQVWSLDFMSDALEDGRRFRILGVLNQYGRRCLGLVADPSIPSNRVARELDRLVESHDIPDRIVNDNGTELTSKVTMG